MEEAAADDPREQDGGTGPAEDTETSVPPSPEVWNVILSFYFWFQFLIETVMYGSQLAPDVNGDKRSGNNMYKKLEKY